MDGSPRDPAPAARQAPPHANAAWRQLTLVSHFDKERDRFTIEALRSAALQAGYDAGEVDEAIRISGEHEAERQRFGPVRTRARNIVLLAYGITWLVFAVIYLGRAFQYGMGPVLLGVLTFALGLTVIISVLIIRRGRPDPERSARAVVILMAIPIILLVGVAGLCLPFTAST